MTTGLTDKLQRIYGKYHKEPPYTETFEEFCESMCATDFLKDDEKYIIRKLRRQWEMNKK